MVCLLEKEKKKKLEEEENIKWAQDKLISIILMSSTSPVTTIMVLYAIYGNAGSFIYFVFFQFRISIESSVFLLYCIYLCDECELVSRLYFCQE